MIPADTVFDIYQSDFPTLLSLACFFKLATCVVLLVSRRKNWLPSYGCFIHKIDCWKSQFANKLTATTKVIELAIEENTFNNST